MNTGLDAVEKKFGQGKIDPNKSRGMNEKITDGARGMFEKMTGKKGMYCLSLILVLEGVRLGECCTR